MRKDPFTGKSKMHNGIDIAMPKGAPVGSAVGGTVVKAGFGEKGSGYGGYGNVVVVKDAGGNLHTYAHLNSVGVKVGQKVNPGQVVGGAGSTGRSTGSHLDYNIKTAKGKYINPLPFIRGSGDYKTPGNIVHTSAKKGGGSSYTNTFKIKNEALKSPSYQTYKKHLSSAIGSGQVPGNWAVALTELIGRESSWKAKADNPSSTAWGYGQFLNSTRKTYQKKFPNLNYSNPVHQIILTAAYVKDRYGTPEKALQFWDKNRWY